MVKRENMVRRKTKGNVDNDEDLMMRTTFRTSTDEGVIGVRGVSEEIPIRYT